MPPPMAEAGLGGIGAAWMPAEWDAPARVHGLTTLRGLPGVGVSRPPYHAFNLADRCGDDPEAVAENRRRLQRLAGLPGPPLWLRQVHGTGVCRFDGRMAEAQVEADAAVTSVAGRVLAVLTADCLPVLLCSRSGDEVAAVHAGWRGLAAGVIERCVEAMRTAPASLLAWIGPAAGPSAYEVGEEVRAAFVAVHAADARAFAPSRPGHWWCDLPALARARLARLGVTAVTGGRHCTLSDPSRFFSHRRDGPTGRMASLVWIAPDGQGDGPR
ncbi:MAG: laccase domain protein [Lysobacteraceae bacterium]|nr:MAG: laccase domain protein [Xanthomonadaceae bacterium]